MPHGLYLDYYRIGVPLILITLMLILYIQKLVKDFLGDETIVKCHAVGSYYLQVVGTFYGVLLGMIVVDSMTKYKQAQESIDREANSLVGIYSSVERFPEHRKALEKLVTDYTDEVINVEFPMMETTEQSDPKARDLALSMMQKIKQIEPETENQKAMYSILLSDLTDLLTARRLRVENSNFGEPKIEWVVLIAGGAITIILTFFFTLESAGILMFMRATVSLTILMSLYLTYMFGSPFSGDLKVSNESLKLVLSYVEWTNSEANKREIQHNGMVDKSKEAQSSKSINTRVIKAK